MVFGIFQVNCVSKLMLNKSLVLDFYFSVFLWIFIFVLILHRLFLLKTVARSGVISEEYSHCV